MKKNKSSKYALSIVLLTGLIYYFSFNYIFTTAIDNLLNQQIENSKNQAELISKLLSEKLKSGYSKEEVRNELQKSIENSTTENGFICMFDAKGKEICHPDKQKIGTIITKNNSTVHSFSNIEISKNFKDVLNEQKSFGGLRKMKNTNYTEIVYLSPVPNTEWLVASHSNIVKFSATIDSLKEKLSLIFIIVWLSSSLLIYFFLHFIHSKNLREINIQNQKIENQYFNELRKIDSKLLYSSTKEKNETKRLLANKGNKLVPVQIENIAFAYTQDKISYIVEHNENKLSINLSMDELMKTFNQELYYRISRQVIVSAKAIDKVEKYGSTQLKIFTLPVSPIDFIVGKAKLTEFKKWLGKN